jgi:hypothetical protein
VRESFSEYKKTIEHNLLNINYLYSGDVISSSDKEYSEIKSSPLTSPIFIINSIVNIYNESFQNMIDKSTDILIPEEGLLLGEKRNIFDLIHSKGVGVSYIFTSDKSKSFLGILNKPSAHRSLPGYLYSVGKNIDIGVEAFYSPLIKEQDKNDSIMYVSDRAIQSFVWIIQNMDYIIEPVDETNTKWCHKIKYKFYDCNFKSYKIIIKNISGIRELKINKILNGN